MYVVDLERVNHFLPSLNPSTDGVTNGGANGEDEEVRLQDGDHATDGALL